MSDIAPQITTMIPTYRRPHLLRRAIQSVLRQTYPNFQVCVYDNASGDETADVVAEFAAKDSRVKYHCHPENIGPLANFEYGRMQVQTAFFNMLFDDDVLLPDFFSTAMRGFEQYPDAMLSACTAICWMEKTRRVEHAPVHFWPREGYFGVPHEFPVKSIWQYPYWMAILYRREVVDTVGPINKFHQGDVDNTLRICCRFPFVISKQPGAVFVGHATSSFQTTRLDQVWPDLLKLIENMERDKAIPEAVRLRMIEMIRADIPEFLYWLTLTWFREGQFDDLTRVTKVLRRDFGKWWRGGLYGLLGSCCRRLPSMHRICRAVVGIREQLHWRRGVGRELQTAYAQIAEDALHDNGAVSASSGEQLQHV